MYSWGRELYKNSSSQFLKSEANSFGELVLKREVVLNGSKGPESDFGDSKIRKDS